jgi:pimeloyl-ACP methyl ester carboxylesterase
VAHGFKGFKDWGFFPWIAARLAEEGIAAFRFNFARNGIGEDRPEEFTRLDLFEENSITREIADLEDLLDAIPDRPEFASVNREKFGLIGHSRGGGVAILAADRRPEIGSLVTWSAVSRFDRSFPENALAAWKAEGRFSVLNQRTGQQMPLGMELLRDLTERKNEIDVLAAEKRITVAHLIVHGEDDESVPEEAARELHEASGARAAIEIIPDTGHTFGAVHPFAGPTEALERAVRPTALHLRITL